MFAAIIYSKLMQNSCDILVKCWGFSFCIPFDNVSPACHGLCFVMFWQTLQWWCCPISPSYQQALGKLTTEKTNVMHLALHFTMATNIVYIERCKMRWNIEKGAKNMKKTLTVCFHISTMVLFPCQSHSWHPDIRCGLPRKFACVLEKIQKHSAQKVECPLV